MGDNERFDRICEKFTDIRADGGSIGTYKEKRLHMLLKHFVCEDSSCYEISVGKCVADVLRDGVITEIQTGSLYPLAPKLRYYLENTDHTVNVIKPVIVSKRIIRVERETGEIIRVRRSPKKVGIDDVMSDISHISDAVMNERFSISVFYIDADEYRYSDERVRYRRSGKFDSELFPRELIDIETYKGMSSYGFLLDGCKESFTAKEYGEQKGFSGRALYRTLKLLCDIGLVKREKAGRSYEYRVVK